MIIDLRPTRLMATSAIVLALSAPAFAQTATDTDTQQPPAATDMQKPADMGTTDNADDSNMSAEKPDTDTGSTAGGTTLDPNAPTLDNTVTGTGTGTMQNDQSTDMAAEPTPQDPILISQKAGQLVSDEIIGMDVRNPSDETIGTIDALVVDRHNRVIAGIVSVGGFLGIGAKDVAVNWKEFKFQPEEEVALVMLSREQLEAAPEFRDREDVQAQVRTERQREAVEDQQERLEETATPPAEEPAGTPPAAD